MNKYNRYLLAAFFTVLIWSCDPGDFELPEWETELFLPLVNADFDITDLTLSNDEFVSIDSSGLVVFVYEAIDETPSFAENFPFEDVDISFELEGIPGTIGDFTIPGFANAAELGVPIGSFPVFEPFMTSAEYTVDLTEYFTQAVFDEGFLEVSISNQFPFAIEPGMVISINSEGQVLTDHVTDATIEPSESYLLPVSSVASLEIGSTISVFMDNFATAGGENLEITANNGLLMDFAFEGVNLRSAALNLESFDIHLPEISVPLDLSPFKVRTIEVTAGELRVRLNDNIESGFQFNLILHSVVRDNVPVEIEMNNGSGTAEMTGTILDLSRTAPFYNQFDLQLEVSLASDTPARIVFNTPVSGAVSLASIRYGLIQGNFSQETETISGKLNIDLYEGIVSGELLLEDPRIIVEIENDYGIPSSIPEESLLIIGSNPRLRGDDEIRVGESFAQLNISPALTPVTPSFNSLIIDQSTEPNFNEFIALPPSVISYNIPIDIGDKDSDDLTQFVSGESQLRTRVDVELPLNLKAKDLVIRDTLDYPTDLDYGEIDAVAGNLTSTNTNYFPLQLLLQTYFLDDQLTVLDSLFETQRIVEAAQLDGDGIVIEPYVATFEVEISPEKVDRIKSSEYIVPQFYLISPGDDFVKILSQYTINFKITGDVRVNVSSQL